MIEVYFDGACSVCAREIRHYQRIAPVGLLRWIDIGNGDRRVLTLLKSRGIEECDALRELHVVDQSGEKHIGVRAFCLIWNLLPRWWVLSRFIQLPGVFTVAKGVYSIFVRYRQRKGFCEPRSKVKVRSANSGWDW